ncbi:hypothetical protein GQF61_14275 [Sphingobacterium sp. DK4209]|uniref:Uncharacterized protein n=1 Tax=Sphingobacterium zhuxiongii TaxID=2662364 RepID=A0A5Q0QAS6_9SPHI|nr:MULTISPECIES: hypothetical protein [unclassified Sphingobacterium]MVZ67024.1 hypothetical protein [Sphingobacterium sp. DK4209]QGA26683.1 hypothetical protein GFH32_10245 [Sphingobacterium sp. dk4302]
MKRSDLMNLIKAGYHVLRKGEPIKVVYDIWYYLDEQDEEDTGVLVLSDLLKWSDAELEEVRTTRLETII